MKNIVLIGSGNVATHLGLSLIKKGYNIKQVWSKKLKNATILSTKLNSSATDSLDNLKDADLYILAIKDDALESIILKLKNINIVHTSGSTSLRVFNNRFINCGIIYPLQTFNKSITLDISKTPICIEANNNLFEDELLKIGHALSEKAVIMNSDERKKLHVAAVFSCNFTNHMFAIANTILANSNIDFKLLLPIINQTVKKLNKNKPSEIQTGPAQRKDKKIIKDHVNSIKDKRIKEIYELISKSIMKTNA